MTPQRNEGIVNRGTITGQSIAVGRGAHAVTKIESSAEALQRQGHADVALLLKELEAQMLAQSAAIERFDEAIEALELVAAGLAAPEPNRLTIRGVLDSLVASVRSVSGVAEAAVALKAAVGVLL